MSTATACATSPNVTLREAKLCAPITCGKFAEISDAHALLVPIATGAMASCWSYTAD
jgi:hypothetical protein